MKFTTVVPRPAFLATFALSLIGSACAPSDSTVGNDAGSDMGPVDLGVDLGTLAPASVVCGANSSTHLHSSSDGIDLVVMGSVDPLQVVPPSTPRCFLYGKTMSNGATAVQFGTYELDNTGHGFIHISTAFDMPNESADPVAARTGATRYDLPQIYDFPIVVAQAGSGTSIQIDTTSHTYTKFDDVVAAIDPAGATGFADTYQLFLFATTLTQLRVPGFGGIGMTRYIGPATSFDAVTSGTYSLSVVSFLNPTVTISYTSAEDIPGAFFNGTIVTMADLTGTGPMSGSIAFEFRQTAAPRNVLLSGSVDYSTIAVMSGIPSSGNYAVTITGQPAPVNLPYDSGATRSLVNILPVTTP